MASTRQPVLHDNLNEGVDATMPAHLIGLKWRTQHNWRLTPQLEQIPRKLVHITVGSTAIIDAVIFPSGTSGYGRVVIFTQSALQFLSGVAMVTGLTTDGRYRRWAKTFYNGTMYYVNDLNQIRANNGSSDLLVANSPKARYLTTWYDHLVAANVTFNGSYQPSTLLISDLYKFDSWTPTSKNEADLYDFVEYQQLDYPFVGCTGIAKLGGTLWVYTPTAIIPLRYVGLPKVLHVIDDQVVHRTGNTFPYTLVALDKVHFFYDGIEKTFFAFDGQQIHPIGEPVRNYMIANLNQSLALAQNMYGFIDVDNREIWWPFVSNASSGPFDKAVVFNYRYKKWFTASVENVLCFIGGTNPMKSVSDLTGHVSALTGTVSTFALGGTFVPRLFGSTAGAVLREETASDADTASFLTSDNPVLESADFHYGDIRTVKENDLMLLNASLGNVGTAVAVTSFGAATLPETGNNVVITVVAGQPYVWMPTAGENHMHNGTTTIPARPAPQTFIAETTTVVVNTTNTSAVILTQGFIEIKVNGRDYLGGEVSWASGDSVGNWLPSITDGAKTYPTKYGRVLRYRFEGKSIRRSVMSAFSDGVRVKGAEK